MNHIIRHGVLAGALGMALLSFGLQARAAVNPEDDFQTTIQRALATLTELQHHLDTIHAHNSATLPPPNPWASAVAQVKIGMTRAQVEALLRPMRWVFNDYTGGGQITTYIDAHTYMDAHWKVRIVYDFHGTDFSAFSLMSPSNRVIGLPSLTQEAAPSLNLGPFHLSVKKNL